MSIVTKKIPITRFLGHYITIPTSFIYIYIHAQKGISIKVLLPTEIWKTCRHFAQVNVRLNRKFLSDISKTQTILINTFIIMPS